MTTLVHHGRFVSLLPATARAPRSVDSLLTQRVLGVLGLSVLLVVVVAALVLVCRADQPNTAGLIPHPEPLPAPSAPTQPGS